MMGNRKNIILIRKASALLKRNITYQMKKTAKNFLILLFGVMSMSLAACSDNNDEPKSSSQKEIYDHVVSMITMDNGELLFPKVAEGQYIAAVNSEEESNEICKLLTGIDCSGTSTLLDMGNYGNIKIIKSQEEGAYKTVVFNISDFKPFVLTMGTLEYFKDSNFGFNDVFQTKLFKCDKCGEITSEILLYSTQSFHRFQTGCWGIFVKI